MSKVLFTDVATTTLAGDIGTGNVTLMVAAGAGALFPQPDPTATIASYFDVVVEDRAVYPIVREIMRCTDRTDDQLTVTRSATPHAFTIGCIVANRVTARALAALRDEAIANQRMLGNFATPPVLRANGAALQIGDSYYSTVLTTRLNWNGAAWLGELRPQGDFSVGGDLDVVGDATIGGTARINDDLLVLGAATIVGATTVGGNLASGGALSAAGALNTGGNASIRGTGTSTVAGSLGVASTLAVGANVGVGGNMNAVGTVSGAAMMIGGRLVAAYDDVSGDMFRQNFPDGAVMKWGRDATAANGEMLVTFNEPYEHQLIMVIVQVSGGAIGLGATWSVSMAAYDKDRFKFRAGSFNGTNGQRFGAVGFDWFAIGV